jgi:lysophospholipid acyltransferase
MLISYPLANLFTKLPRSQPWLRHLFNIGVSSFYLLGVFHLYWGWLQLVVSSMVTYVIAKYYKGNSMPWVVFVYVLCPTLRGVKER